MSHKELVRLLESDILIFDRLAGRLHGTSVGNTDLSRVQMSILVRLYNGGRARLKDIARREGLTTPNLCAVFRKLEGKGLVSRAVDDADRRNTWYSVTESGADVATNAIGEFRSLIAKMFSDINHTDEVEMISALKTINSILTKMELNNA
ncbi:MAG: MarR family transcriptional regulator [Alphaproteobacteria bacterium]|nr:MarR family transcriptional regulator [Alphaproteobacteria bacterium]